MDPTTERFLAISAIAGGALRIVNAFTADMLNAQMLQVSYAVTDILLLLGLAGILLHWRFDLERLGFAGVGIAVMGLTIIRGTGFTSIAMEGYTIGAGVSVIGVALLAADMLWRRVGAQIAPYLWLAAFGLAIGSAFGGPAAIAALAGIAFGAGFVFAGIDLLVQGKAEPRRLTR